LRLSNSWMAPEEGAGAHAEVVDATPHDEEAGDPVAELFCSLK
jgi:hypothetical protein